MAKRKLPKRPKKPKLSAGIGAWNRFDERMKDWARKCSEIKSAENKKQSLIKKYSRL